ncbi:MAG TPA: hypothetical protein VFS00_18395, partial [Polyangiaceae bacterium]|nr:hypothetical protein [Polyangiaceae bacterium]
AWGRDLYAVVELQHDGFGAADANEILAVLGSEPYRRGEMQALGRDELAAHAPSVPPDAWAWMHRLGRLRTRVRPVARAFAEIEVQSGGEPPPGSAALVRDRQAVLSVRVRGAAD